MRRRKFDLLIIDLALPDGDGGALLSLLPSTWNKGVPVIIFSATDISRRIAETIRAALVKSTTSNEMLLHTIRSAIAAHRNIQLGK